MVNYKPNPTYYRITFNNAPYASLTGTQAGGLDCIAPLDYNSQVRITGNSSSFVMSDGDHFYINGYKIVFAASDNTINEIIVKINLHSVVTNVTAIASSGYITLINSPSTEAEAITLATGAPGEDALAVIGFAAGVYKTYPNVIGGAIGTVANGDKILINGVEVTMTGGTQSAIVSSINSATNRTGVAAYAAAGKVQIGSLNGQPWTTAIQSPTTINPAEIGFPAGVYAGTPATLDQSEAKTRANFRWLMVQAALEEFSTPFLWNDILTTGNFDGTTVPTTISWTVGYEHPDQIVTIARANEPNPGTELKGTEAIKRAVARGMIATYTANAKLWDPTTVVRNYHAIRPNSIRINQMTADGVDTVANITSVEDNVIVDMITYE